MAVFNEPQKWAQTLGKDADVTTIPNTAGDTDPSIDKIFPSVFSIPLANGGRAIPRSVLNGLFKLLGDWCFYQQNGGVASYSADFDYAVGSVVKYNNQLYICLQENGASSTVKTPANSDYWLPIPTNPLQSDLYFGTNALRIRRNDNDKYLILIAGNDSSTSSNISIGGNVFNDGSIILRAIDANENSNSVSILSNGNILWKNINLKSIMSNCAMPSNTYEDLTLGASGSSYVAPADGYVMVNMTSTAANQQLLINVNTGLSSSKNFSTSSGQNINVWIPISKGATFYVTHWNGTVNFFRFVYAIGSQS